MSLELAGTICFGLAVLHTFFVGPIARLAHRHEHGVVGRVLHALSEVELVFGFWAVIFLVFYFSFSGATAVAEYVANVKFTEPLFVFAIMLVCSSRPILTLAKEAILILGRLTKFVFKSDVPAEIFSILTLGSLAGSLITEPAAMTVSAILLRSMIRTKNEKILYGLVGVLFVNVSIGGALTTFAAPPILMVAGTWGWDVSYVFFHIGWKSAIAVLLNSALFVVIFRSSLSRDFAPLRESAKEKAISFPVFLPHLAFLGAIIFYAHHELIFLPLLAGFVVLTFVTRAHQVKLRVKESVLVGIFLAGIVLLGPFQSWWVRPLIENLSVGALFLGATALTSITDNAALTYLGSQIPGLSDAMKNALVEGAIAGGGLTIIANAPNPAGVAMLREKFADAQIAPLKLFLGALGPTVIAVLCLWFLPFLS